MWVVRAGRRGRFAQDFRAAGIAAIGWAGFGDVGDRDRGAIVAAARELYGDRNAATTGGMLYRFAHEIAVGDWIVMPVSAPRELHAGRVTGPYEHRAEGRYPHVRPVAWDQLFGRDELAPHIQQQLTSMLTVFRPSAQDELREFLEGQPA